MLTVKFKKSSIKEILKDLSEENILRGRKFFNSYELESMLNVPKEKTFLGDRQNRKCRFCNKSAPQVTFKNIAHVLPSFMGNNTLFSYFECDECNEHFSLYEDSLAKFIGPIRTILQAHNKKLNQIPKFKNPFTDFEVSVDENGLFIFNDPSFKELKVNEKSNRAFISTAKQPYIPLYAFKALLKLGMSQIKESELRNFETTMNFLTNKDKSRDAKLLGNKFFTLLIYSFDHYQFNLSPRVLLFYLKNKKRKILCPQKTLVVYYGSNVFQMIIPFHNKDEELANKKIHYPIFPLLFPKKIYRNYGKYNFEFRDMSSIEKISDDLFEIKIKFLERKRNIQQLSS